MTSAEEHAVSFAVAVEGLSLAPRPCHFTAGDTAGLATLSVDHQQFCTALQVVWTLVSLQALHMCTGS